MRGTTGCILYDGVSMMKVGVLVHLEFWKNHLFIFRIQVLPARCNEVILV